MESTMTYDEGFHLGYDLAFQWNSNKHKLHEPDTDFEVGRADGYEQGQRDVENERMRELEAIHFFPEMEQELDR